MTTKYIPIIFLVILLHSCSQQQKKEPLYPNTETAQTPAQLGEQIFNGKGSCVACHQPDQKIIGPSITEIAKIYKSQNGDIVSFLKGEGKPIVDPSQYEVMKSNFAITKNMSDAELEALEAYIYSHLK